MARVFDPIDEWELYVPDVGDERKIYKDDPDDALTCEVRFLSKHELDRYNRIAERAKRSGPTKADTDHVKALLSDNVRNVRNYSINGTPITDGSGIYEASLLGDGDILLDVVSALVKRSSLEAGLAKKLRSPSGSPSSQAQRSDDGDAADVIVV